MTISPGPVITISVRNRCQRVRPGAVASLAIRPNAPMMSPTWAASIAVGLDAPAIAGCVTSGAVWTVAPSVGGVPTRPCTSVEMEVIGSSLSSGKTEDVVGKTLWLKVFRRTRQPSRGAGGVQDVQTPPAIPHRGRAAMADLRQRSPGSGDSRDAAAGSGRSRRRIPIRTIARIHLRPHLLTAGTRAGVTRSQHG